MKFFKDMFPSEGFSQRLRASLEKGKDAIASGVVGHSLSRKTNMFVFPLRPKAKVDASWIWTWKNLKHYRQASAKRPMGAQEWEIKFWVSNLLLDKNLLSNACIEKSKIIFNYEWFDFVFGDGWPTDNIIGQPSDFDPRSGAAWYAVQIVRRIENYKNQALLNNIEQAAYHALQLGLLVQELRIIERSGEFHVKAKAINQAQKDAGSATIKKSIETRKATYQKFRNQGDKKTQAAENAANELGVSTTTIRNAFQGKLP